jgi:HD-like signal output (HDOD) protein
MGPYWDLGPSYFYPHGKIGDFCVDKVSIRLPHRVDWNSSQTRTNPMTDPQGPDLEQLLSSLPILPTLVGRLVALDMSSAGAFDEVVGIAEEEPTFAVRIQGLANSAMFAPLQEITSIRQAVSRVGAWRIAELCSSLSLLQVFTPQTDEDRSLWLHAIQTAVGARRIASVSEHCQVEPQEAYLIGLLHDFGRFALAGALPDELRGLDEVGLVQSEQLVVRERDFLGVDHAEFGARVAEHWGLPSTIAAYMRRQHDYSGEQSIPGDGVDSALLQVIQIADHLSVMMMLEPESFAAGSTIEGHSMVKCVLAVSSAPPIDAKGLGELALGIREEADALAAGLGV